MKERGWGTKLEMASRQQEFATTEVAAIQVSFVAINYVRGVSEN